MTHGEGAARRGALDGIRALAVLAVFFSHTGLPHTNGGWVGVEVFFVLSGYLITAQLLREHERAARVSYRNFYARRLLRLYPALLVLLALGVWFPATLGDGGTLAGYGRTAAAAGLYVQDFVWGFRDAAHGGFGHTWSLAVEEQFYLVWPPLLMLLLRRRTSIIGFCLAASAVSLVVSAAVGGRTDVPGIYFLPWGQAPTLLAGCALAAWRTVRVPPAWGPWCLAGLGLLIPVAGSLGRAHLLAPELALAALLTCGLVASVEADPTGWLSRWLSWRPLAGLGLISYGFYLFHLPVIEVLTGHLHTRRAVLVPLELAVSIGLAVVSWVVVEKPFNAQKVHFPAARSRVPERRTRVGKPVRAGSSTAAPDSP